MLTRRFTCPPWTIWLALIMVTSHPAQAQNCKKGIPCGHSCISATKVCRIGQPTPAPTSAAAAAVSPSSPRSLISPTASGGPAATAGEFPWVGSFADGVYFRADCPTAQDLAPANRRYFRTIQDAEGAGFRRSRTPTC